MEQQSNSDELRTKDLYEAGFLIAKGLKLLRLERERAIFFFVLSNKDKKADELRDLYWSGDGLVSGRVYADSIRTLKDRLFAGR